MNKLLIFVVLALIILSISSVSAITFGRGGFNFTGNVTLDDANLTFVQSTGGIEAKQLVDDYIGYFRFDEDNYEGVSPPIYNENTTSDDGAISTSTNPYVSGKYRLGTYSPGSTNFVNLYKAVEYNITDYLTISVWAKESGTQTDYARIVSRELAGVGNRQYRMQYGDAQNIQGCVETATNNLCVDGGTLTNDTWYHLLLTYNKDTGELKFYKNSVLKGTVTGTAGESLVDIDTNLILGRIAYTGDKYFKGTILKT